METNICKLLKSWKQKGYNEEKNPLSHHRLPQGDNYT